MRSERSATGGVEADEAFATAYDDHSRAVHNLARTVCGPSSAEDVTQNVFLALWRNPGRFDPSRGSLRTLLLTMTHNMAIDLLRSGTARRQREDRAAPHLSGRSPDIEAEVESDDNVTRILRALDTLPGGEKDAIVTSFYGGCTYRQTAVVLGQPEGTVKSRIRAGLRRLPEALDRAGVATN
ncbi:MAG: hypothetical protein NVS1B12_02470 [Acidimicrobiales bacterium]